MTIGELWELLDAADAIAVAHGYEADSALRPRQLEIVFRRGSARFAVVVVEADLASCATVAAAREMVERRVAEAFVARGVARRAIA